jgi:hypothetical protein
VAPGQHELKLAQQLGSATNLLNEPAL